MTPSLLVSYAENYSVDNSQHRHCFPSLKAFALTMSRSRALQWVTVLAIFLTVVSLSSEAPLSGPISLPLGDVWGAPCPGQPRVVQFLGIPFGQPTWGKGRFRPPKAYNQSYPKAGLHATGPPPVCPQKDCAVSDDISEDCLYLNLWVPAQLLDDQSNGLARPPGRPVRVFIHGGAFSFGGASEPTYRGCNTVAATNTLQVNLQYRLGAFGFMGHPGTFQEAGITGNWGLQDQQLGLRWVQENIAAFGGDPSRVMIFGESAGGMSVGFQVVMPSSAGLFHAAISQSGAPFTIQNRNQAYAAAHKFVQSLDCAAQDPAAELACLRSRPMAALLDATLPNNALYGSHAPTQVFFPIVDGTILPRQPLEAIADGAFNRVPYLMGTNRDEGRGFAAVAAREASKHELEWDDVHQFIWKVFPGMQADKVLELYSSIDYRGEPYTPTTLLTDFWTDVFMKCPTQRALLGAQRWGMPVWQYLWSHSPSCATNSAWSRKQGPEHFSEVAFVFGQKFCEITEAETHISLAFMRAWAAMATNRRPVLPGGQTWPTWHPDKQQVVMIDNSFEIVHLDLVSKCKALDEAMGMPALHDLVNPYSSREANNEEDFMSMVRRWLDRGQQEDQMEGNNKGRREGETQGRKDSMAGIFGRKEGSNVHFVASS